MKRIVRLLSWITNRGVREREMEEELRAHIEMRAEDLVREGLPKEEAYRCARVEFGGLERTKEECREVRGLSVLDGIWQDLRFGGRMLKKSPGFTATAVISLALGIGANTGLFSLVNAVLLGSLPVRNPQELVVVQYTTPESSGDVADDDYSYPMYRAIRNKNTVFSGVLCRSGLELNASLGGQSERVSGELVSGNYYETLGVTPYLGRLIAPDDDRVPGEGAVAVLSYGYWQRRFGGDGSIVGRDILLNSAPMRVIGVTPAGFYGTDLGRNPDIRVPMMMAKVFRPVPANRLENPRHSWLTILARRKPEVTTGQAQAALDLLYHQELSDELAGSDLSPHEREKRMGQRIRLEAGNQGFAHMRSEMERPLMLMFGATAMVLLIACANLVNLIMARNAKRRQEVAVRLAIGAGNGRLVRQWLTESLLLSAIGGAAGVAVAYWAKTALIGFMPREYAMNLRAPLDWRVLVFALAATMLTGLLSGLAPALELGRAHVAPSMREGVPATSVPERLLSLRSALVFGQVALSLPLLIGAGLFLHSLANLRGVNTGFTKENVYLATLNPSLNAYPRERVKEVYDELLTRVRALPGVKAASLTTSSVISGGWDQEGVRVEGYTPGLDENMNPNAALVSTGYFATLGIPVVKGRDFTEQDTAGRAKVAIVNETMARYFFGDRDPLGKKMSVSDEKDAPLDIEIVGVVKDAKYVRVTEATKRHFYTPMAQEPRLADMTLQVRTSTEEEARHIGEMVKAQLREIDANVPLYAATTLEIQIDNSLVRERLLTWLSGVFGVLATLLAAVGLAGVVAFSVARRTKEIGIRMALGAQSGDILREVLARVTALVAAGLMVGLALAFWVSRAAGSVLFEVKPSDPAAFVGACVVLGMAAMMAGYWPARRAVKVDPMVALRWE